MADLVEQFEDDLGIDPSLEEEFERE